MLTPHQQRLVWEGWLGAEIRAYYFADLCGTYQRQQTIVTWLLLTCASGAAATLTAQLPTWLRSVLTLATAGLSLWLVVAQNQKHAADCADLHYRWYVLATRYEDLWDRMDDPDAASTLGRLKEIAAEISKASTAFPNDAARMGKWQDLVEAHHHVALPA